MVVASIMLLSIGSLVTVVLTMRRGQDPSLAAHIPRDFAAEAEAALLADAAASSVD